MGLRTAPLYCGNALDPASYRVLLRGDPADIVFTDPPYNVRVAGHVSQRADAREFAMASGELSSEEFVDFLQTISAHIAANVANGAVVYICMDWRHLDDLSAATRRYFGKPKNMIVWVKQTVAKEASIAPNTNISWCMWPARPHRPTISVLANGAVTERTSGVTLASIRLDGTASPP